VLVVEQQNFYGEFFAVERRKFLDIHLERAIAVDVDHQCVLVSRLDSHGCWQTEAHGSKAAAAEPSARLTELKKLGSPHLVLTDADGYIGLAIGRQIRQCANRMLLKNSVKVLIVVKRELGL